MKKWRLIVMMVLGLVMTTVTFSNVNLSAYAYTEEEKQMVKDWLSAHGYPPTMAGAEQAYQDYLNGMWGGPGGGSEEEAPAETMPTETEVVIETEVMAEVVVENTQPTKTEEVVETETETVTETETETETASTTEALTEESLQESVAGTEDLTEEDTTEQDSSMADSEAVTEETTFAEQQESAITVGKHDSIIVVVALVLCVAMVGGTVFYIKKSKKEGK